MAEIRGFVLTASKREANLSLDVTETLKEDRKRTGQLARTALASPTSSLWPVDTGVSKKSFSVRSTKYRLTITNSARTKKGIAYPYIVEARYRRPRRPAATTVALALAPNASVAQAFFRGAAQGFTNTIGRGQTGGFGGRSGGRRRRRNRPPSWFNPGKASSFKRLGY